MPATPTRRPGARHDPAPRRRVIVALLPALASVALCGCPSGIRDRTARKDVESLQTNVVEMESVIRARQAGVIEQIRDLREEQARLDKVIQDGQFQTKEVGRKVDALRERTREEIERGDRARKEGAEAAAAEAARLAERIETVQTSLAASFQAGLKTVNDNLLAMSEFEKKQEARISRLQEQLQEQLRVIVEEVGKENQALRASAAALREELDAARQEAARDRQGLADLQQSLVGLQQAMQQIADQLAATQTRVQELAKKQEALGRKPAAAARAATHVVKAGETLTTIAARYGVSLEALMTKNRITDANSIGLGQKLAIPEP